IRCLENGVDVIVEKPLAVTVRAGRRMIEAAERNGRILCKVERYQGPINEGNGIYGGNSLPCIHEPLN
ncbi:TPA: hypothetical protein EYP37_08830, partial [Candidatus Poribacteria bacterium]|nr:hypothetical protein [Candidatus Poribacteria bacterium]